MQLLISTIQNLYDSIQERDGINGSVQFARPDFYQFRQYYYAIFADWYGSAETVFKVNFSKKPVYFGESAVLRLIQRENKKGLRPSLLISFRLPLLVEIEVASREYRVMFTLKRFESSARQHGHAGIWDTFLYFRTLLIALFWPFFTDTRARPDLLLRFSGHSIISRHMVLFDLTNHYTITTPARFQRYGPKARMADSEKPLARRSFAVTLPDATIDQPPSLLMR